jgi:hypothetical protein
MLQDLMRGTLSALIAYSAHYGATKFYSYICVPDGVYGYFQGFITTGAPICQIGVKVISNTQVSYSSAILIGLTRFLVDIVAPGVGTGF